MDRYQPNIIEPKWQKKWEEWGLYQAKDLEKKPKKYLLIEFPYPSGERLHVGHGRSYCCLDAMARLSRMKGFNVLYPIGWDAFGLPAENYAIKTGINPSITTKENIDRAKAQAKSWGLSFDWSREINTTDPNYYKWTQWIFIQLFKKGLAYQADVIVNWCPKCQTNLADEEVLSDGTHERCGEKTERRMQKQWLIKITAYAERLLKDLDVVDYREDIKRQQVNWIGKSEGAEIKFSIFPSTSLGIPLRRDNLQFSNNPKNRHAELVSASSSDPKGIPKQAYTELAECFRDDDVLKVFTTRLDTIFGATFLVIAPEHPILEKINKIIPQERVKEVSDYIKKALNKSELERISEVKEKSGVFTGLYAINPFNNEKIPIFIADYVVMTYGTGAIMGVPCHDRRDFAFAKKYGLKINEVIKSLGSNSPSRSRFAPPGRCPNELLPGEKSGVFIDYGVLVNSSQYSGLTSQEAIKRLLKSIIDNHIGSEKVQYHLRDWVFSRQHYWGEPIPLVFCENCAVKIKNQKSKIKNNEFNVGELSNPGWITVPEENLPVELPYLEKYQPSGTGESPLAKVTEWVNIKCPKCGGPAKRETDTMPNWAGSNWYYLGYLVASEIKNQKSKIKNTNQISKIENIFTANKDLLKYWLPVDLYNGGMEHTTLHLLYSRFIYKFLYDIGCVPNAEPYARRWSHGVVLGPDNQKMSKSRGNVINPDDIIKKYGADTFRLYEGFIGPFEQTAAWSERGVIGCYRFLKRIWELVNYQIEHKPSKVDQNSQNRLWKLIYKTNKKVENDIWHLKFNTAIAALMELLNDLYAQKDNLTLEMLRQFLLILSPFAPFISEELWQKLNQFDTETKDYVLVHQMSWPKFDEKLLVNEEVIIAVQVNGKLRDTVCIMNHVSCIKERVEEIAKNREKIAKYLKGKTIKKVIFVPGRLINFVV